MTIPTIKAPNRYYGVKPDTAEQAGAPFLELGPAGTEKMVSTMVVQFNPTAAGFTGSFIVVARVMGPAAQAQNAPFEPVPYQALSLNNVAQIDPLTGKPPWSIAQIVGPAIITIPANGMSVGLQFACTAGQMDVLSYDLQGNSSM